MGPVLQSIYGVAMVENTNAYQLGEAVPYKWVAGSFEAFVWPGGAGVTLMLLIAILLFSKRADYKTVGKLGIGPGLFNINEPVMFGLPIVLNPLFIIPFIVATILSGFLATGGDWRAIILTIINLAVALLIWAPFIIAANKINPADQEN